MSMYRRSSSPAQPARVRGRRSRRLLLESLETRCLLAAAGELGHLLYAGIAEPSSSPTNPGLLMLVDTASGRVAPWQATFSSPANTLAASEGWAGLAFSPSGRLYGATGGNSSSRLVEIDPVTGTPRGTPVAIRAGAQSVNIFDLAAGPGSAFQLYGVGEPAGPSGGPSQLYVIDPGTGQAVAAPNAPAWLTQLSPADGLAWGPDGTLYVTGRDAVDGSFKLYVSDPHSAQAAPTVHTLTERIVGLDVIAVNGSAGVSLVGSLQTGANATTGALMELDPATGRFARRVDQSAPTRGVVGDVAVHPDPQSLSLQIDPPQDFEEGNGGYWADNGGGTIPGLWHDSAGRHNDKRLNHTPFRNWYYGQFETSTGGGTYLTGYDHQGILNSPPLSVPPCATTVLSFSYLLGTRESLNVDFVEVRVQYTDDAGRTQTDVVLSRAAGTLPQTGNRWLTATVDLSPYAGRQVVVQYSFDTGDTPLVDPEGWYVDDVVVASIPHAVCGYKWLAENQDKVWDASEPGRNGTTVYADVDGNRAFTAAQPDQAFYGAVDANAFAAGNQALDARRRAALSWSAAGSPVWAMPNPEAAAGRVLAWGAAPGEAVWQVGQKLRIDFAAPVHTVSLQFARGGSAPVQVAVLEAFDANGNHLGERPQTLADGDWHTVTFSDGDGAIAYVLASAHQGAVLINGLQYWGTQPAVDGDPWVVTANDGRHDGAFAFDRLPPGTYEIREVLPEGWKQASPGEPDFAHTVTIAPGQSVVGNWQQAESPNFGNFQPQISGYKWLDENRNGVWDAAAEHTGLNGWTIYVDLDQNGSLDRATEPFFETRWDGEHDGAFWFDGLPPGTYVVREEVPELWKQSYPGAGTQQHQVVVSGPGSAVGSWQDTESPNFGNYQQTRLRGVKWDDGYANGQWDTNVERGLSGWVIQAYRDADGDHVLDEVELAQGPAASKATDTAGQYELLLDPGDYVIVEIWQDGWVQSFPQVSAFDSSVDLAAWPFGASGHAVTAAAGQTYADLNFGNYQAVDLRLTKTESADPVIAGSGPCNLTYVVTVTNLGPLDASGVEISEDLSLPAGVTVCSITPSQGSFVPEAGPDGIWSVGSLAANAQATLTVVLTVDSSANAGDVIGDTATVTAANETRINQEDDTVTEDTTVRREVDLRLTKSESVEPVVAGSGPGNLTYVVTVVNSGPSDATGVEISESLVLPECVTVADAQVSRGVLRGQAPDYLWDLGNLPAGDDAQLTVTVTASACASAGAVVGDTASVTQANEPDRDPNNDTVSEETTVRRETDLSLDKSDDGSDAVAGTDFTYVLKVTNHGPSDSTAATVVDTLPTGWRLAPSYNPRCRADASDAHLVTCTVEPLRVGETATFTVTASVPPGAAPATASNVAQVTAREPDPKDGNDEDREPTDVIRQTDLALSKSDDGSDAVAGQNYTYTLEVTNLGPSDSTGATVVDVLPPGWTLAESSNSTCLGDSNDPQSVTCTVGVLPIGAKASFTITASLPPGAVPETVTNLATVTAHEDDPDDGNNRDGEEAQVQRETDLALDKSDDGSTAAAGAEYTYTLKVTNHGPSDSTGATVTDVLPPGWTFAASSNPTCAGDANDPQTVTCTIGSLAADSTATFTISAAVPLGAASGTVTNWAEVEANETDRDGSNNRDSEQTAVSPRAESVIQFITPLSVFRPDLLLPANMPDFTDSQHGHVLGSLWYDVNQDGAWEENEPPLSGWTVYADANGNGVLDDGETSDTTRDDGRYVLSNLPQESHLIRPVVQPGWTPTSPADPAERQVLVRGYATLPDVNFGVYRSWDVHGYKWSDLDQDGVWDADEPGMAGWPISLETALQPDDFPVGTALNEVYAQLTLSAVGSDGNPVADPAVVSAEGLHPESGTADPDNRVFGHAAGQVWSSDGPRLRIDFDQSQREVSIDVLAVGSGTSIGRLEVYDAAGNLLTSRTTFLLSADGLTLQRITIPRSAGDIQYAVVSAQQGSVQLDALRSAGPFEASQATTAADGGYYFTGVVAGRYALADAVPAAIQTYPASSAGHAIELASGQTVAGNSQTAETPNFGVFDYSPFVRPADNPPENWLTYWCQPGEECGEGWSALETVLAPWQSFSVTNSATENVPLDISLVSAVGGEASSELEPLVQVYLDRERIAWNAFPVSLPPGEHQFYAFYTPNKPDWLPHSPQAHTFAPGDRFEIVLDGIHTSSVLLVGASTYDSDILYDGTADDLDASRLDDVLLSADWPIEPGEPNWDPTSDINVRHPNGAPNMPEIALGDFGPLNVEFDWRRAPFLDLDRNNNSGARGTGYATAFWAGGTPVPVADPADAAFANAAFANFDELRLQFVTVRVTNLRDAGHEFLTADTRGTNLKADYDPASGTLTLSTRSSAPFTNETISNFTRVLRTVKYSNTSETPDPATRSIAFTAVGDEMFGSQRDGNVATAMVRIEVPQAAGLSASLLALAVGEGPTVEQASAPDAAAASSSSWHNAAHPCDVNGADGVTPRDALAVINYLDAHPAETSLPNRSTAEPPFYDVNEDGACTPLDALRVINFLDQARLATAEGEADALLAVVDEEYLEIGRSPAAETSKTLSDTSPPRRPTSSENAPQLLAKPHRLAQDQGSAVWGEISLDDSGLGLDAVFPDLDAVLALVAQGPTGR